MPFECYISFTVVYFESLDTGQSLNTAGQFDILNISHLARVPSAQSHSSDVLKFSASINQWEFNSALVVLWIYKVKWNNVLCHSKSISCFSPPPLDFCPHVFPSVTAQYKSQFLDKFNLWLWPPFPAKLVSLTTKNATRPLQFWGWGVIRNNKLIWSGLMSTCVYSRKRVCPPPCPTKDTPVLICLGVSIDCRATYII